MLVDELAAVVDLVVDHDEDVLLGVVLGNILVGVLLGHDGRIGSKRAFFLISGIRRERERDKESVNQELMCKREKEGKEKKHLEGRLESAKSVNGKGTVGKRRRGRKRRCEYEKGTTTNWPCMASLPKCQLAFWSC